jgi:hypothetical protein
VWKARLAAKYAAASAGAAGGTLRTGFVLVRGVVSVVMA